MLKRVGARLATRVLADGTKLSGTFSAEHLVRGTAELPDGRVFSGDFDATTGVPCAGSKLVDAGDQYVGEFSSAWRRHGKGQAVLADGTQYRGTFDDDDFVSGTVIVPDARGDVVFEGTLRDETFVEGTLTQQHFSYTGAFQNNQPHGQGRLLFSSGAWQEGTFVRGELHGDNCKSRLSSGDVYIGTFVCGRIQSGELRTATFVYEGDFDESGMASGAGRAEYLNVHPRLVLTGHWAHGKMVQGHAVDEFGTPVDYTTQASHVAAATGATADECAASDALRADLQEKTSQLREMNASFCRDADRVQDATGVRPDKHSLGYERGLRDTAEVVQRRKAVTSERQSSLRTEKPSTLVDEALRATLTNDAAGTDVLRAAGEARKQLGFQRAVQGNADDQFQNYVAQRGGEASRGLDVDGNAPWKSLM